MISKKEYLNIDRVKQRKPARYTSHLVLFCTILLSGCGNKGALYLPEKTTQPQAQLQPAVSTAPRPH